MTETYISDSSKTISEGNIEKTDTLYDTLLTTKETSKYLKISPRTLYRYIKEHNLPAFKLGREWRFVRSELDKWLMKKLRKSKESSS